MVAALFLALCAAAPALAAPAVTGIFTVKGEVGTNNKIVAGPDGNMWMTVGGGEGKDVARITPGGQVTEYDLGVAGTNGIAAGPEGLLWVPTVNAVTSFSPADPEKTAKTFATATINSDGQIVAAPNGEMWVASANGLAKFSPADPTKAVAVPFKGELAAKDIDVAGSLIVISDASTTARILAFDLAGKEQSFPIAGASQGVAGGPGGQIAYTAAGASPEQAGLIAPPTVQAPFELLGDPFGVTLGSDGAYWIVQFEHTKTEGGLTRLTTDGQRSGLGGLPLAGPRQIAAGPGNTLWVTIQDNKAEGKQGVARISGVDPAPPPTPPPTGGGGPKTEPPVIDVIPHYPETKLGKHASGTLKAVGAKAKAEFSFSSVDKGATFQCALVRLKKKGQKAPVYKACRAPKTYRLTSGRYRFLVRAVLGGVADPSPAKASFKVVRIAVE